MKQIENKIVEIFKEMHPSSAHRQFNHWKVWIGKEVIKKDTHFPIKEYGFGPPWLIGDVHIRLEGGYVVQPFICGFKTGYKKKKLKKENEIYSK